MSGDSKRERPGVTGGDDDERSKLNDNKNDSDGYDEDEDEDYDEDLDESLPSGTLLGFAEPPEFPLVSKFFPSKVGGKPAWLNLRNIPEAPKCPKCAQVMSFLLQIYAARGAKKGGCDGTFHRTLFLFLCRKASCLQLNKSIRVFRSQLPRHNDFYSSEPPQYDDEDGNDDGNEKAELNPVEGVQLCYVCGVLSSQRCSRCRKLYYCSRTHQAGHWRGGHREACVAAAGTSKASLVPRKTGPAANTATPNNKDDKKGDDREVKNNLPGSVTTGTVEKSRVPAESARKLERAREALRKLVFPEYEVLIEEEMQQDIDKALDTFDKEKKLYKKYNEEMNKMPKKVREEEDKAFREDKSLIGAFEGNNAVEIREEARSWGQKKGSKGPTAPKDSKSRPTQKTDRYFDRFQALTKVNPEQVIRYNARAGMASSNASKGGDEGTGTGPLWISKMCQADRDSIPKCRGCGREREFEFQVMPQLLNFLDVDPSEKDAIDWGVIAVYTCPASCGDGSQAYFEEYAHCQFISER
mmetsp:Transcript_17857/g.24929  ORF Transcript_17857/g.24929 Transcript_17857/m.24929 type:complete len:525 (-) Transcript_17857:57-1631(-)|eukprot:CAMPEP_0184489770 /NCGR_PEP_ID=MMETSP0113_2-20130426/16324_1 /TAXON_ID=91329 /ORGANISM="Norrisiella sphaerica, Strain BC52" /LENGTH=524 /DNA_ID=CAMNT_0026873371 /DNA_START=143 /DNA_END=1720 /DNA_ORIENTATION=+